MANANRPSGLTPVKMITGAPYNGAANIYSIDKDYTTALYVGDPVISSGTANDKGIQGITLAATTGPIRGVIVGIGTSVGLLANPSNLDISYRPGAATTADWYALVVDDPNVVFEVQEIGTGTPLTKAACGLNADLESGTGNGFVSGWMLGNDNEATTATLQVRLLGLAQRQDNAFGQYAKWEVLINAHELRVGQAGV